jgi:hypothetical protein
MNWVDHGWRVFVVRMGGVEVKGSPKAGVHSASDEVELVQQLLSTDHVQQSNGLLTW